jgi:hypothetical protein
VQVEPHPVEAQQVAGGLPDDQVGAEPAGAQAGAQRGDPVLHLDARAGRRPVVPDRVDEPVDADHPAGVQQQAGQQAAGAYAADPDRAVLVTRLDRAEDEEAASPRRRAADHGRQPSASRHAGL